MKKKLILAALLGAAALFASEFKVNNRVPAAGYSANGYIVSLVLADLERKENNG
jgi:hypothetical protein